MYILFLSLRYLRKRRIAFFAVAAVSLCVAMVLILVSVMGGFLQMVKDRSRGMLGDLIMENTTLQGFSFYQEFIDEM
jgi:lipoprotein-releasing system permease protein